MHGSLLGNLIKSYTGGLAGSDQAQSPASGSVNTSAFAPSGQVQTQDPTAVQSDLNQWSATGAAQQIAQQHFAGGGMSGGGGSMQIPQSAPNWLTSAINTTKAYSPTGLINQLGSYLGQQSQSSPMPMSTDPTGSVAPMSAGPGQIGVPLPPVQAQQPMLSSDMSALFGGQ